GDPERYRSAEEVNDWREQDPLALAAAQLRDRGVERGRLDDVRADVDREVADTLERARDAEEPPVGTLYDFVTSTRAAVPEPAPISGDDAFRMMDAVREALEHELEVDPDVFLMGIDIAAGGGVFGVTRGLHARWPDRVLDTPISEVAIVGGAVGA